MELPTSTAPHGPCPHCGRHHGNGTGVAPMLLQGAMVGAPAPTLQACQT